MPCAGPGPARLVVTHRRQDWRSPGRCVRPSAGRGGCRATGPGLTGSSLASQSFWRRLRRSAKRSAEGHRGHHARIHAVGRLPSRAKSNVSAGEGMWGGWGSNPRPADYEKYGPAHRMHYLHEYHEAVPLMAPIALFAPIAQSTNRSTAKRRSPPVLLLCVTSPGAPSPRPRKRIARLRLEAWHGYSVAGRERRRAG